MTREFAGALGKRVSRFCIVILVALLALLAAPALSAFAPR
jgi:hypothetical protein